MPGTIPAARKHLIDSIAAQARSRRARKLPGSLPEFVQSYYRGVDESDGIRRCPAARRCVIISRITEVAASSNIRGSNGQKLVFVYFLSTLSLLVSLI